MRAATRDVAFGTNVRAMLGTAGADTNFTVTFTSTTSAIQTVNPYTNISNVTADNRTNLGWAFNQNEASADGVGSGDTSSGLLRKRVIPAGSWSFEFAWTASAPALLATRPVVISYTVYRVAANGGARSLLFETSAASNTGNSGDGAATSAAQPAYVLEPNETIHVAVRIQSQATSNLLGGTNNTVVTCTRATSGSAFVTLPAPGMRDLYLDSSAGTGEALGVRSNRVRKDVYTGTGEGSGLIDRMAEFFRTQIGVGEGDGDRELITVMKFAESVGEGAGTRTLRVRKDLISAIGEGEGLRSLRVRKDLISAIGEDDLFFERGVVFVRDFLGIGESIADLRRTVIFVRDFNAAGKAVIRPRIALDWDDLPDVEGGSVVVVEKVFRPIFIFDD